MTLDAVAPPRVDESNWPILEDDLPPEPGGTRVPASLIRAHVRKLRELARFSKFNPKAEHALLAGAGALEREIGDRPVCTVDRKPSELSDAQLRACVAELLRRDVDRILRRVGRGSDAT